MAKNAKNNLKEDFILFFSVDIVDSTRMKYENENWPILFANHYSIFQKALRSKCGKLITESQKELILPPMNLWKTNGDEILFYISINESFKRRSDKKRIQHRYELALWYIKAFAETIQQYNDNVQNKLKVKGTAWSGNTPTIDYQVLGEDGKKDFIGKSIDIGFRLSKYSTIGKMMVSVELAIILLRDNLLTLKRNNIQLFFDSIEILKGVLKDKPYPIFWINMHNKLTEIELAGKTNQQTLDIMQYLEEYIKTTSDQLHYPYIPGTPNNEPFSKKWDSYDNELRVVRTNAKLIGKNQKAV